MDPNNQQQNTPSLTPVAPTPETPEMPSAEATSAPQPEAQNMAENPVPTPEVPVTPISPEAPFVQIPEAPKTAEVDQLSKVADPSVQPSDQNIISDDPATQSPTTDDNPVVETERPDEKELDKKYFQAADRVIDEDANKPFEEEEMAEDLQIGYLKDRFGKTINKSDD